MEKEEEWGRKVMKGRGVEVIMEEKVGTEREERKKGEVQERAQEKRNKRIIGERERKKGV